MKPSCRRLLSPFKKQVSNAHHPLRRAAELQKAWTDNCFMLLWDNQLQPPGLVFHLLDNTLNNVSIAEYPQVAKKRRRRLGAASLSSSPGLPSGELLWRAVTQQQLYGCPYLRLSYFCVRASLQGFDCQHAAEMCHH